MSRLWFSLKLMFIAWLITGCDPHYGGGGMQAGRSPKFSDDGSTEGTYTTNCTNTGSSVKCDNGEHVVDSRPDSVKRADNPDFDPEYNGLRALGGWLKDKFSADEESSGSANDQDRNTPYLSDKDHFSSYELRRMKDLDNSADVDRINEENRRLDDRIKEQEKDRVKQRNQIDEAARTKSEAFSLRVKAITDNKDAERVSNLRTSIDQSTSQHNLKVDGILSKMPSGGVSVAGASKRTFINASESKWGKKVDDADRYIKNAQSVVERMPDETFQRGIGRHLLNMARGALSLSDEKYAAGNIDEGNTYLDIAYGFTDMALGFVPGVSWGKDLYESITGTNLVTGDELSTFERTFAVVGVVTVGIGSKVGKFEKVANVLRRFGKAEKVHKAEEFYKAIDDAEKIGDAAKEIGLQAGKDIMDFVNSGAGKVALEIKSTGQVATEDGYKFFSKVDRLNNSIPENGTFARVMPRQYVEELKAGNNRFARVDPNNPSINEAFITAADDLSGLSKGDDIARKLSLFEDQSGTMQRKLGNNDVIVEFQFKDGVATSLRSPIETPNNLRNYGFVGGGKTSGGAREWLIDTDAAKKGYIDLSSIKIREITP